uniref:Uncharacterized protein n=1 Tax=Anguilla anguilla TaxID=7936 RepID=A0A0E9SKC5_ANGAN
MFSQVNVDASQLARLPTLFVPDFSAIKHTCSITNLLLKQSALFGEKTLHFYAYPA